MFLLYPGLPSNPFSPSIPGSPGIPGTPRGPFINKFNFSKLIYS